MYVRNYRQTPITQQAFEEAFVRQARLNAGVPDENNIKNETPSDGGQPASESRTAYGTDLAATAVMLCLLTSDLPTEEALLMLLLGL